MRRRFQKGSVKKRDGAWIGQWWENGHRRNVVLGRTSQMTKRDAMNKVAEHVRPINSRQVPFNPEMLLKDFINDVYFVVHRRRWKGSTRMTVEYRVKFHIASEFGERKLDSITREELQSFLERKAEAGLSFSTVDHLRWDLHQIFSLAVSEGHLRKNPAELLVTPKSIQGRPKLVMSLEEVNKCFSVLDLRDRLIVKLAVLAGMRPGEILALRWKWLTEHSADVQQRVYRGELDVPKTRKSNRKVALPDGLLSDIQAWKAESPDVRQEAWVFPSETLRTPLSRDNVWRRSIQPKLATVGLCWASFQVMRRTHSTLMNKLQVDPKLVADQLGHTLDVNQNVYTIPELGRRRDAVNQLEAALQIS
jgi:integrase